MGETLSMVGTSTVLSLFVMMIASPKHFFKTVDQIVLNEPDTDFAVEVVNPLAVLPPSDNDFLIDTERLKKFDQVIKQTKNKEAKRLWSLKREQYLRQMRWKQYVSLGKASERC